MTLFPTIQAFKEELNNFKPPSEILKLVQGYYALHFKPIHGLVHTGDATIYSSMLKIDIAYKYEGLVEKIDTNRTMKALYLRSLSSITREVCPTSSKKERKKYEHILSFLSRQDISSGEEVFIENQNREAILKIAKWMYEKKTDTWNEMLRQQLIEVLRLLIIREKENVRI